MNSRLRTPKVDYHSDSIHFHSVEELALLLKEAKERYEGYLAALPDADREKWAEWWAEFMWHSVTRMHQKD